MARNPRHRIGTLALVALIAAPAIVAADQGKKDGLDKIELPKEVLDKLRKDDRRHPALLTEAPAVGTTSEQEHIAIDRALGGIGKHLTKCNDAHPLRGNDREMAFRLDSRSGVTRARLSGSRAWRKCARAALSKIVIPAGTRNVRVRWPMESIRTYAALLDRSYQRFSVQAGKFRTFRELRVELRDRGRNHIYDDAYDAIEKTLTAQGAAIASCGIGAQEFALTTSASKTQLYASGKRRLGRCIAAVALGETTPAPPSGAAVTVTVRATTRYY